MRNFRLTAAAALLTALIAGPSWSYTPGTYEASAQGMKGPVKVAVTFSKDAVTSVREHPRRKKTQKRVTFRDTVKEKTVGHQGCVLPAVCNL